MFRFCPTLTYSACCKYLALTYFIPLVFVVVDAPLSQREKLEMLEDQMLEVSNSEDLQGKTLVTTLLLFFFFLFFFFFFFLLFLFLLIFPLLLLTYDLMDALSH